jgi:hypothetical protein
MPAILKAIFKKNLKWIAHVHYLLITGVEIEGPIGVNISALESAGVNLTELAEKLRNDTEVDEILGRTKDTARHENGKNSNCHY